MAPESNLLLGFTCEWAKTTSDFVGRKPWETSLTQKLEYIYIMYIYIYYIKYIYIYVIFLGTPIRFKYYNVLIGHTWYNEHPDLGGEV